MAVVCGVQLKAITQWEGSEGYGVSASIYIGNKKVGRYIDYGDGSMADTQFDDKSYRSILAERAARYFEKHPPQIDEEKTKGMVESKIAEQFEFLYDSDAFLEEILRYAWAEKCYKKFSKKGLTVMVYSSYPYLAKEYYADGCTAFGGPNASVDALAWIEKEKSEHPKLISTVYKSLSDFEIE